MTDEAQIIAIATACGWQWGGANGCYRKENEIARRWEMLPDYTGDLNAMREAENTLPRVDEDGRTFSEYFLQLMVVMKLAKTRTLAREFGVSHFVGERIISATAAQRAEAFLRTIGKWVES